MENESTIQSPYPGARPMQTFDVDAEVFDGEYETPIGNLINISRVQDEAGWVIKYYMRINNPNINNEALPLGYIRKSFFPYGSITLQRNESLMLVTIDFNPYMRPVSNNLEGWKEYILWHYNHAITDSNATLFESEYGFGI